jgi:hypothetical protein
MSHPLEAVPVRRRRTTLGLLCGLTALLLTLQAILYIPLRTPAAPWGIISLELAWTPQRLDQILASWSDSATMGVLFSLKLSYLGLLALTTTTALACVMVAGTMRGVLARAGVLLAWGQWAAALLWTLENSLIFRVVLVRVPGHAAPVTIGLASFLAAVKFALTGLGLIYATAGGLRSIMMRPPATRALPRSKPG